MSKIVIMNNDIYLFTGENYSTRGDITVNVSIIQATVLNVGKCFIIFSFKIEQYHS